MSTVTPRDRARQIMRMSKRDLIAVIRANANIVWTAHPMASWNKDELVNEALRCEGLR